MFAGAAFQVKYQFLIGGHEPNRLRDSRQLLKVSTVRGIGVVLPVKETLSQQMREVRLRVVSRPDRLVAELLLRLGLDLPTTPKMVQNEKWGVSSKTSAIPRFGFAK